MDRLIAEIKVDKDELREVAKEVFERNFDGMTNEEVIKTLFPKAVLHTEDDDMYLSFQQGVYLEDKDATWLNAPYKNDVKAIPSAEPKKCKDCKWWKDSDGVYRRGIGAESKCPINNVSVNHGLGYCYMFEPQERSEE